MISHLRLYQSVFSSQLRKVIRRTTPAIVKTTMTQSSSKTPCRRKRHQLLLRNKKLKSQSKNRRNKRRRSFRRTEKGKRKKFIMLNQLLTTLQRMKTKRAKTNKRLQQPLPRPITMALQRLNKRKWPRKSNPPNSKRQLTSKRLLPRKRRRRFNHRLLRSRRSHQSKRMKIMTMSRTVPQMKRTKNLFLRRKLKRGKWNILQSHRNNQILKTKSKRTMMKTSSLSPMITKRPNMRLPNRSSLPSKSLPKSSRNLNKRRRDQSLIKWPFKTMPLQQRLMSILQPHKLPLPKRGLTNRSSHPKEKYSNTFLSPRRPFPQTTVWVIGKSTIREQRRKSRRILIVMMIQSPATE